jgi:hypothetical protein
MGSDFIHLDYLRYVCLDFLARIQILLGMSVVGDNISPITFIGNLLGRGGGCKYSFVGLLNVRSLMSSKSDMTNLN